MTITTMTKKVAENVKEMKNYFIGEAMKSDMFADIDSKDMQLLWKMLKMMDDSVDLMLKQAEVMDDMSVKIDLLVENIKKGEA